MEKIDCKFTRELVCPYCGYKFNNSWELRDEGNIECESCEKIFDYERDVVVSYISYMLEENA